MQTFPVVAASWRAWIAPLVALVFFVAAVLVRGTGATGGGTPVMPGPLDGRGFKTIFVDQASGSPVRYNACEPVSYVINPSGAPQGAITDVHTAFDKTAEATGIRFEYAGATDEPPALDRDPYQPERYGEDWAPILIGWASLAEAPTAAGDAGQTVGLAASVHRWNDSDHPVYVTGAATFEPSVDLKPGFAGETWGQVILHELGHVVGLDHISDPASVMNPMIGLRPAMWGGGDRAGLWSLGMGSPCLASPSLPN